MIFRGSLCHGVLSVYEPRYGVAGLGGNKCFVGLPAQLKKFSYLAPWYFDCVLTNELQIFVCVILYTYGICITLITLKCVSNKYNVILLYINNVYNTYTLMYIINLLRWNDVPRMSIIFCPKIATFSQF